MKTILLYFVLLSTLTLFSQTQIGADIDGEAFFDQSGKSVGISANGEIIAIGAPKNDGNGNYSGHVRVYKNISNVWTQIGQDIDGEAAGDESGSSISLSSNGGIIAIGAVRNTANGNFSGHVRVYQNISNVWTQIGQDIDGEAAYDQSGYSVSISSNGQILAVSAPKNDGNGTDSGHVRVYENISNVWTQIGQDINGEAAGDNSGERVSLSSDGSIVAISAMGNDGNGGNTGHVRVFKNISNVWTQIGQDIDGEVLYDNSGDGLSLSPDGSTVAIGASRNDDIGNNNGHVRIYKYESNTWTQIGQDIDGEPESFSGIGISMNTDGTIAAIGAHYFDVGTDYNIGHVRIYQFINNIWTQVGVDIIGEARDDSFGISLALTSDGSKVAVGATGNDGSHETAGHVRVFELSAILGKEENLINKTFTVYPNPAKNTANLHMENSLEFKNASIYNCFGQLVQQSKTSKIDVSALASGLYFIEVETNKGKGVKKFIKE